MNSHLSYVPRGPRYRRGLLFPLGLGILAIGALGDLAYHAGPSAFADRLEPMLGPEAVRGHLATLAGMAIVLASVVRRGIRS